MTKKPMEPGDDEVRKNSRSRSAKLRIIRKNS
jgi:16S rRNA C1402 N4-methylase RsmH